MRWVAFKPDRTIRENRERYRDVPDTERAGVLIEHPCSAAGGAMQPAVIYLLPGIGNTHWTAESWEPLTVTPSLRFMCCGDHGHIRDGKWVPA
jgi:hypothetical protein